MADNNTITWGGMIKGAVKIAASVAVGVAIFVGAGYGLDAAFSGSENETLKTIGQFGTSMLSAVTGVTSSIASFISEPLTALMGSGSEQTLTQGNALELAEQSELLTSGSPQYDPNLAETYQEAQTAFETELPKLAAEITATDGSLSQAIEAAKAAAGGAADGAASAHLESLEKLQTSLSADTIDLQQVVNQFNEVNTSKHALLAEFHSLSATPDTNSELIKTIGTLAEGDHLQALEQDLKNIVSTHNHAHGAHLLKNVPESWAIAGGAVAGANLAHAAGRYSGAKEVIGEFTKREMQRRAAMAAQQQQV